MYANGLNTYAHRNPSTITFIREGNRIITNSHDQSVLQAAVKHYGTVQEIEAAERRTFSAKHLERFSWMCRANGYDVNVK